MWHNSGAETPRATEATQESDVHQRAQCRCPGRGQRLTGDLQVPRVQRLAGAEEGPVGARPGAGILRPPEPQPGSAWRAKRKAARAATGAAAAEESGTDKPVTDSAADAVNVREDIVRLLQQFLTHVNAARQSAADEIAAVRERTAEEVRAAENAAGEARVEAERQVATMSTTLEEAKAVAAAQVEEASARAAAADARANEAEENGRQALRNAEGMVTAPRSPSPRLAAWLPCSRSCPRTRVTAHRGWLKLLWLVALNGTPLTTSRRSDPTMTATLPKS